MTHLSNTADGPGHHHVTQSIKVSVNSNVVHAFVRARRVLAIMRAVIRTTIRAVAGKIKNRIFNFLLIDLRASTAIEFAFIAPIFFSLILFLMSIGYISVMNATLAYATNRAARQIQVGSVQSANTTQTQFASQIVCPLLSSLFDCTKLIVNIQPVPAVGSGSYPNSYYQFVNSGQTGLITPPLSTQQNAYCPGNGLGYVYLQVLYPVTILSNTSIFVNSTSAVTYNGGTYYLISSTATFRNEPFSATSGC